MKTINNKAKKRILILNPKNQGFLGPFNFKKVEGYEFPLIGGRR